MKINKIRCVGHKNVYDISVKDAEHYILENGVITHNTGIYYSSNSIFIMGRQQEKDGTEVTGYNFIINVEKSRFVKEKSKIPICVSWEGGVSKWSGLIDVAMEGGYVIKPKVGWFQAINPITGEDVIGKNYRLKDTDSSEFWDPIFAKTNFAEYIKGRFTVGHSSLINHENENEAE